MTVTATGAAPILAVEGGTGIRRGWVVVAALAVTQTVGYGVLTYAFTVLLLPIAAELHTSTTAVTGAMTASVLAGAVAAVPVGRWLDRHGGRVLMTAGSVLATLLVAAWSRVDSVAALYAVLVGLGLTGAMVLYEPAFAVVVAWFPDPRHRATALLAVTVVAGFASSIFLPLTGHLAAAHGWRTALLVLAGVHGAVTIPLHAVLVRRPTRPVPGVDDQSVAAPRPALRIVLADRRFLLLTAAFVAQAAALSTFTIHLVAYLVELGHPAALGASIAGLLGLLSVAGRLGTTAAQRRLPPTAVTAAVFAVQALAAAALPLLGASTAGAVTTVVAFGLGFGVATIARPLLLTQLFGTTGYATLAGALTVPVTVAKALAPLAAAGIHDLTGAYPAVFVCIGVCCALAATGIVLLGRR
ncbi:MFS transporter [Couchioplanes azureus]|uniref:MFS transporter n=1 Tax=Couchioplanes caeruleus TaxID=56438 RepID=UPI00166FB75B|nr:MFS transporter [Couchioplanes caeruleus]GGQ39112.1 MFS transporter [Couchioplanes caeruleus subsp. azureus]